MKARSFIGAADFIGPELPRIDQAIDIVSPPMDRLCGVTNCHALFHWVTHFRFVLAVCFASTSETIAIMRTVWPRIIPFWMRMQRDSPLTAITVGLRSFEPV